jgi:hypothetical protein
VGIIWKKEFSPNAVSDLVREGLWKGFHNLSIHTKRPKGGRNMGLLAALFTVLHIAVHSKSKRGKMSIGWMLVAGIWGGGAGFSMPGFGPGPLLPSHIAGVLAGAVTLWAFFFGLYYVFSGRKCANAGTTTQSETTTDMPGRVVTICPKCDHTWSGHWDVSLKDRQCPQCGERWRVT